MKTSACRLFIASFLLLSVLTSGSLKGNQQELLEPNPQKARLIYQDVENFINIYQELLKARDPVKFIEEKYFKPGTAGLKIFLKKYDLTARRLWKAIQKHPGKYGNLPKVLRWLKSKELSIRNAYRDLKKYIPEPIYPPTYFLIGSHRGIGSGSEAGQLITIEKWDPAGKKNLNTHLVHELVHLNQAATVGMAKYLAIYGREKSLLALCIREGIAEFFAYLVTGRTGQEEARLYLMKHEQKFKRAFKKEMLGNETGDWMWKKPEDPQQPMHIGYSMGFLIARAYYLKAEDKMQAAKDLLSVTDYPAFLRKSGYLEK